MKVMLHYIADKRLEKKKTGNYKRLKYDEYRLALS